jgi:hypothetical protein
MHELGGDLLGERLPLGVEIGTEEIALATEQLLEAQDQGWPLLLGDLEMPAEIEQGALAHTLPGADGFDQAMGEIGFTIRPRFDRGTPDNMATEGIAAGLGCQWENITLWHYK